MPDRNHMHLALSPAAKIGAALAGLVLLAMLAVLIAVLLSLEGTRSELRTTRAKVSETEARLERITGDVGPLLSAAEALDEPSVRRRVARAGNQVSSALDDLPDLATRARQGVDAAVFLAQDVADADLGKTLQAVRVLADGLTGGDRLTRLLDTTENFLTSADSSGVPRLVASLDTVGPRSILACDAQLRDRPLTADGQVSCLLRTVPNLRALLRDQLRANRRSVGTQLSQLSVNRRQLSLFEDSIGIQRQLLVHLRSLDRKTGGTAPSTPTGP